MSGLFAGTPLERPVTCEVCEKSLDDCTCPRNADGNVRLPKDQKLTVRKEKRSKGKIVTVVDGLDPDASDLAGILRKLKSSCGAGGTTDPKTGQVEIQGEHRTKVAEALRALGYPAKEAGG